MTKFDLPMVSEYLVGTWSVGIDKSKLKEFAIIMRSSLIKEWWGKDESQILLQILKSPVIIRRFGMLASESLRYFKVEWEKSE